jgi:PAS domain S-box-containing protein
MGSFLDQKVRSAFGFAMLTLLLTGAFSYHWLIVYEEGSRRVLHTHDVLQNIQDLNLAMESIEAISRGFALTGKETDLDNYGANVSAVEQHEAAIRTLTTDNPTQQGYFPFIETLTADLIQHADMVINLRRSQGSAAAASAVEARGNARIKESFQATTGKLQQEELRLLALRRAETGRDSNRARWVLIVGTLLGMLLVVIAARSVLAESAKRQGSEDALQESEEKYRMLLDGVQDYAIFMLDPQGQVASWSTSAERMNGYSAREIVGQNFSCFFLKRDIDRGRPEEVLWLAAANGWHEEVGMFVRKDGSEFLANLTFRTLRNEAGNLCGFSQVCRNLSEHKSSKARFRGLLEAAPDGMVVVDEAGEIVLLNAQAEKQFGYRRDELLGLNVTAIIPKGFAERLLADGARTGAEALAQQIGTGIELIGHRKDGTEFPIEIMLSPFESAEGILVTSAIRDITVRKNAERQLAETEAKYRGLLEAAPDGMVVVNEAGEIVLLNARAEKQFGYRRDVLLGRNVKDIIPQGFAERLLADGARTGAEALAQQIGTGIELIGRRKDGTQFPIEIMLSPFESAERILVTSAIRDITVRKNAEKHLAETEAKYRGLLEAAPDGMVVVNEAGEIVLLNARAEKQFGYRRDVLLGRNVKDIIPEGFAERLLADGARTAAEARAQQIGTGIELIGRCKDRTEFPIEIMLSPFESAEGILMTSAIRDITVRKNAERHLAETEAKYRGLLEAAPDGMVVVNEAGEIVLLNARAEQQFGYRRDVLLGRNVKDIIPEGFAERLLTDALRTNAEALAQQIDTGIELHGRRKDGTRFPIEIMLSPLESAEGVLVTAAIRDISERKQLERQLHQSQKMEAVGQLTGGIAHDFNNLLGVIIGNLYLLDLLVSDNEAAVKRVKTAQKAATRGVDITRRLLVFSRDEVLRPAFVSLEESIQSMIEMAFRGLGLDIKITADLDPSMPPLFVDRAALESALLNLVVNARDAMPKGGSIIISSVLEYIDDDHPTVQAGDLKNGYYACLSVTDTGQGMSQETLDRACEPFFTTKPLDKGTGLGLAMVYGFAKQSGGVVRIHSELGHGTTVSIYLPIVKDLSTPVPANTPKTLGEKLSGTVLVVEDEVDLLEVALVYLEEMGLTVFSATDGASALEMIVERGEIDLMVTDIVMPGGMNGPELVQRACVLCPNLKIIYSSGFTAEALAEKTMTLVDGPLLRKPYQREEFAAVVRSVMEGSNGKQSDLENSVLSGDA